MTFDQARLRRDYIASLNSEELESFYREVCNLRLELGFRSSCSIRDRVVVFDIDVERSVLLGRLAMAESDIVRRMREEYQRDLSRAL